MLSSRTGGGREEAEAKEGQMWWCKGRGIVSLRVTGVDSEKLRSHLKLSK